MTYKIMIGQCRFELVGFQNSATAADLRLDAAGPYSLTRPPRTRRRPVRSWLRPKRDERPETVKGVARWLRLTQVHHVIGARSRMYVSTYSVCL